MTPDFDTPGPAGKPPPLLRAYPRLANAAYGLAFLSPLSIVVRAIGYVSVLPRRELDAAWTAAWLLFALCGPVGVVFGSIAARRSPLGFAGPGRAWAAVIVGLLGSAASFVGARFIDENSVQLYSSGGRTVSCQSNVKQLCLAVQMYAQDYDDRTPLTERWNTALFPYHKSESLLYCSSAESRTLPSYAMNRRVRSLKLAAVGNAALLVCLFESVPGIDRAGGVELLPDPPRHNKFNNFGFLDGHARAVQVSQIPTLNWQPAVSAAR